jgi:hypothetical protein
MEWRRGDRAVMLLPFLFVCILSLSNADPEPSQRPLVRQVPFSHFDFGSEHAQWEASDMFHN